MRQQLFVEVWTSHGQKLIIYKWIVIMADLKHGVAGGMAGITVDVVFYPLETIKTRIMASKPG